MDPVQFATILQQGETQHVEFKGSQAFAGHFQAHLAVSIIAFANTGGGGMIVLGIDDGTRQVVGLTDDQVATYDTTPITNYLRTRVQPLPVFHIERYADPNGTVVIIHVAEFETTPLLVIREIAGNRSYAREGDLLIRSVSCECRRIVSPVEWDDLLQRALRKKGEWLIKHMRSIFLGTPEPTIALPPAQQFDQALPTWLAARTDLEQRHPQAAYFELCLLPLADTALPLLQAADLVRRSAVTWRGWDFPQRYDQPQFHAQHVGAAYHMISDRPEYPVGHDDAWQVSGRGAFGSFSTIYSELTPQTDRFPYAPPPDRPLAWTEIIYCVTEYLRFAATYADLAGTDHIWLRIALRNVQNRQLGSYGGEYLAPYQPYQCFDPALEYELVLERTELVANWQEIALGLGKQIYTAFQLPNMSRDYLQQLQRRIIEQRG